MNYTFVAPYEELKVYTVKDAVSALGDSLRETDHVSAIIFARETDIYPANARGLLQVIRLIENNSDPDLKNKFFSDINLETENGISKEQIQKMNSELDNTDITSWGLDHFRQSYGTYCHLTHKFRCDRKYDAHRFMSKVGRDWHPIGLSTLPDKTPNDPCDTGPLDCAAPDWNYFEKNVINKFGSRIF